MSCKIFETLIKTTYMFLCAAEHPYPITFFLLVTIDEDGFRCFQIRIQSEISFQTSPNPETVHFKIQILFKSETSTLLY